MVVFQELREKVFFGFECDFYVIFFDIQYCLLEYVGQVRYNGRVQKIIGLSFFKMDLRFIFYYFKRLRKRYLVIMQVKNQSIFIDQIMIVLILISTCKNKNDVQNNNCN